MAVKQHYQDHLAYFYEWMIGDFEVKQKEQELFFARNNIVPSFNKVAIDCGAGHGLQSISLHNLGFNVKAIDFDSYLLRSLIKKNPNIEAIESEILNYLKGCEEAEIISCMGDTIAHFESIEALEEFFAISFKKLVFSGKLIVSFRCQSEELKDINRFIPVKADENRILTCFLEYFDDKIRTTDLLHEKVNGQWEQKVSSYYKLWLSTSGVKNMLRQNGFNIIHEELNQRMVYLISSR